MDKKRAVLVRTNLVDRDPWLEKEIDALQRGGYAVTLLSWDRERRDFPFQPPAAWGGFKEVRLRLKAPWGAGVLLFLPVWWCFVLVNLLRMKWDIVQAINFDSIMPAVTVAELKRLPVIYQVFDIYADVAGLPQIFRSIAIFLERLFMRLADAVIIANETQAKEVNGIPNKNFVPIYSPAPDYASKVKPADNRVFTIFYAGVLFRMRRLNIDKVFQAIKEIDGVKLAVAGYGDMDGDIKRWVSEADGKAEFLGRLTYPEVLDKTVSSDLLFALYSGDSIAVKHATCNKVMEAMMASKPIIVTRDTAMADMVNEENCGIAVDPENVNEIRQAILKIKNDHALYRRLGVNGRKAYEQKYHPDIMEKRLLDLYRKIANKNE